MLFNLFVILGVIFFWLCVVGFAIIIIYFFYACYILPILAIFSKKWRKRHDDMFRGSGLGGPPI